MGEQAGETAGWWQGASHFHIPAAAVLSSGPKKLGTMVSVDGAGGREAAAVRDIPCHCHTELWAKEARIGGAGVCENRTPLATAASPLPNLPTEFSGSVRGWEMGNSLPHQSALYPLACSPTHLGLSLTSCASCPWDELTM